MGVGVRDQGEGGGSEEGTVDDEVAAYVLRNYPQYGLRHIFHLSFLDGGLTYGQLGALYELAVRAEVSEKEFQAKIHGLTTDGQDPANKAQSLYGGAGDKFKGCVPGDPETYTHLTKDEKEEWTQFLLGNYSKPFN